MATKKQSFETKLEALEDLVENLESGELSLEESLKTFEKGVKLTRDCQQMLDNAKQKVLILTGENETLSDFSETE